MFVSDKKIRFIQNGIYIPNVGRVYYGKEMLVNPKRANQLIAAGYAEIVVDKAAEVALQYEVKKGGKNGKRSKLAASESASEDNAE